METYFSGTDGSTAAHLRVDLPPDILSFLVPVSLYTLLHRGAEVCLVIRALVALDPDVASHMHELDFLLLHVAEL